jgi:hypothetical protein
VPILEIVKYFHARHGFVGRYLSDVQSITHLDCTKLTKVTLARPEKHSGLSILHLSPNLPSRHFLIGL